jgi:hypothetical protein
MNCTSSPSLIETLDPELRNRSSIFAEEGSAAHAFAEYAAIYVVRERKRFDKDLRGRSIGRLDGGYYILGGDHEYPDPGTLTFEINDEMHNAVQVYADTILQFCEESVAWPRGMVETTVFPLGQDKEVYGTADCILHDTAGGTIWVIDFKYGRGVKVTAQKNPQAMFYAAGVVESAFGDSEIADGVDIVSKVKVNIVIVQPRVEFADGRSISDWRTTVGEIRSWVNDELLPAVEYTTNPALAKYEVGGYCRWCPAAAICPLQQATALKQAQEAFGGDLETLPLSEAKNVELIIPDANDLDGISSALKIAAVLDNWSARVKDLADNQAVKNNKRLPGFKVVRKRTNRKWVSEKALEQELREMGALDRATNVKIKSPTQLEKAGFDKDFVSERSLKPDGGMTVVPEDDPRKEASNAVLAFSEASPHTESN